MQHHAVSNVDTDVTCSCSVSIRPLKEDQVPGLCLTAGNNSADVFQSIRGDPSDVPAVAAVIDHPAHEAGAVKAG